MVVLISYDLNGRERPSAYTAVREMIEKNAHSWARPLYSQWFVDTSDSVYAWHERLQAVTDENDCWFICEVRKPYMGMGNKDVWAWLEART